MKLREWLLLIALSVVWGGSFFFNELALRGFPTLTVVFLRTGLAALLLLVYIYGSGKRLPRSLPLWGAFAVMGALNNLIPFTLIVWGQSQIDSGLASILNATTPLFTVLFAHFLTSDERLSTGKVAGVVLGLAGVALLIGFGGLNSFGLQFLGQLAVLMASAAYAVAAIFGRRFKKLPAVIPAGGMLMCSAGMMMPLSLVIDRPWQLSPPPTAWLGVLGLAVFSTALAYLLYFHILSKAGATNVLLVTFLIPVSAVLLGIVVLGESFGWNMLFGGLLIFIGLAAVDGRLTKYLKVRLANEF